jgi:diadenosine tetraphosphate (Ap4A) HIT family hydrolase
VTTRPQEWMPRARWDALVRGEGCPWCAEVAAEGHRSGDGYWIAELGPSHLRLAANQWVPGYCVLVCTEHVVEPYQLPEEDQAAFFADVLRAARALERVFRPVKLNYELLGNSVPHLHCHLTPRYYGDPAPGRPIHQNAERVFLSDAAYAHRIGLIREALRRPDAP